MKILIKVKVNCKIFINSKIQNFYENSLKRSFTAEIFAVLWFIWHNLEPMRTSNFQNERQYVVGDNTARIGLGSLQLEPLCSLSRILLNLS
jgi:hypothetical protein